MKLNHKAFGTIEIILAVVLIVGLAVIGYSVYQTNQDNKKVDSSKVDTSQNSKTTKTSAKPTDETASWLLYKSPGKEFSIRLADGWMLERYQKTAGLYAFGTQNVTYHPGTKASVTEVDGGKDGEAVGLFLSYNTGTPYDVQGTLQAGFKTAVGLEVDKYYYTETSDAEGIGALPKGGHQYTYLVKNGTNGVFSLSYGIGPTDPDQYLTVEKAITTVVIN